jgi:hypothetical protein
VVDEEGVAAYLKMAQVRRWFMRRVWNPTRNGAGEKVVGEECVKALQENGAGEEMVDEEGLEALFEDSAGDKMINEEGMEATCLQMVQVRRWLMRRVSKPKRRW